MAADLPLPKTGLRPRLDPQGQSSRCRKSRGNVVRPEPLRQVVGRRSGCATSCCVKSSSARTAPSVTTPWWGGYNSDLANGIGNLASRTLAMLNQYRGGVIPAASVRTEAIAALKRTRTIAGDVEAVVRPNFEFHQARLEAVCGR